MKLSKKIIACMLTCILALSMLTACGGGGGGTPTSTLKLANVPLVNGKVTLEGVNATDSSDKLELGTNGTSTYVRETEVGSDDVYLKANSSLYYIDLTAEEKEAQDVSSNNADKVAMELYEAMLNVKDHLSGATSGKTTVNGIEYYSETTTVEINRQKINFAYCFEGNTLKYIVVINNSASKTIISIRVTSVKSSVDDSLLTVNGWIGTPQPSTKVTISVYASPSDGGIASGSGMYTVGNSVTAKAIPYTGYQFVGWQKNGITVSTSTSYTFTASESVTLIAVFKKVPSSVRINISVTPYGSGTVSGSGTYAFGDTVTVKATPNTGYQFVGWQKDGTTVSTSTSYTFTASESVTLTAAFEKVVTIGIAVTPSGSGTVSGAGTYTVGDSVTVIATPNTGYQFVGWQKNGTTVSTSTSYTFTASESVTLTAAFEEELVPGGEIPISEARFPDATFRSYVSANFDKDNSGGLSESEINSVVEIKVTGTYTVTGDILGTITSLKGIEYFTNLKSLYCEYNKITSLDISKNTALIELHCDCNNLTSLNVSKNTALETLSCSYNDLTRLDVSRNTSLKILSCSWNELTSLEVSKNPKLEELYCFDNKLVSLDVTKNPELKYLSCGDVCNGNLLTSLDVSKNPKLEKLECGKNKLTSLDVSKNPKLTYLHCGWNENLTSLDVSKNPALTHLECWGTKLTSLDVSGAPALKKLICDKGLSVIGAGSDVIIQYE